MVNAHIGTLHVHVESARGTQHPPVLHNLPLKPNQGVLPCGLLLEHSASGLVPYDPDVAQPVAGVLDAAVDTGRDESGLVIIHGSALRELLKVGVAGAEPTDTDFAALINAGVYPE